MNKKSLIILCIVFAILVGLVFVKKSIKPKIPTTEEIVDIIVPSVNIDGLSDIVLRLGGAQAEDDGDLGNVHLAKENGEWIVKTRYGVHANEKTITPVLEKLDQLKGELRSDKKGLFSDYGIGDDEGVHVELRQGEAKNIHVVVGTHKVGYQNNFVRFGGTNAVYVVNENLLGTLGVIGEGEDQKLDTTKWVDKRIAHLAADDIIGVAITQAVNGSQETVMDIRKKLVGENKKWQSVKPYAFGLSAAKIKSMVEKFNGTYARDVIAPDVSGVFDVPGWTGTFTLESGGEVKLVRGAKDEEEKNYYVKQEGAGYFYLVSVSTFDNREKQQGDIFASNPLKVEEGNVDGIEIHDLDSKKKFSVLKMSPPAAVDASAGDDVEDPEAKEEVVWQTPDGEAVETSKVKEMITKIKDMNLEAVSSSVSSPKGALTMSFTKNGETQKYTISKDAALENGKECHFLRLIGADQDYCVSKAHVTALQNILP